VDGPPRGEPLPFAEDLLGDKVERATPREDRVVGTPSVEGSGDLAGPGLLGRPDVVRPLHPGELLDPLAL